MFTLVIVPVRYDADGSGRLPDTSDEHIAVIRDKLYATYPVSEVVVRVDPPMAWDRAVGNYNQWANLLDAVSDLRNAADEPPNTYYYGLGNPSDTLNGYCYYGCFLGLSNLPGNNQLSNEYHRASIGLGYRAQSTAVDTLVHEVGHANGREHAPCGGASGVDRDYPYNQANLGSWGYDLLSGDLYGPAEAKDMMGYCVPVWVSDYTFEGLRDRIVRVSQQTRGARQPVTRLRLDGAGNTSRRGTVDVAPPIGPADVEVQLFDASGAPAGTAEGWLSAYSHIPGGVIALDRQLPEGWTTRVLRQNRP